MSSSSIINSVRQHLAINFMLVDNDWLAGCVEYLCEDSSNKFTEAEIKNLAREQWLLNDLKDICPGSLPANLKNQAKTILNGRFVLQINGAIDIGTPAYQQYLKLQKVNMENVEATTNYEDKISSHRMIKLYLTDGVQEVSAIEYRTMRNLSCDITPGCKILIKGPVECRRGTLLLTEGMIELLGGEVGEITVSNSLAGLISSKLGLPMTPASDLNSTISQPRNTTIPSPHSQMPPPAHTDPPDHRPVARVTSIQAAFTDDIDIDQLDDIEAQIDIPTKRSLTNPFSNPEKKIKIDLTTHTNTNQTTNIDLTKNTVDDYPDDSDFFNEDEDYLNELENEFARNNQPCTSTNKFPVSLQTEPYVYIKQINDLPENKRVGRVLKIKGQIMKLLSKLSVGKEGWSLKCTLVDGTGSIDVDFTSEVLSKLVGFTPQEMNQLKKQMATRPELKQKAVSALQKAKDNLQVLYCIIELTLLEVPKITCLTPFNASHADLQRKRIDGL